MMEPNNYDTLSEAEVDLRKRGFATPFEVDEKGLYDKKFNKHYSPQDVTIVEHHRFEGDSDPEDMAVIYAIETNGDNKGVLIDAYGAYSSEKVGNFIRKVGDIKQQGVQ